MLQILPESHTEFWPWWANLEAISRSISLLFSNPYIVFVFTGITSSSCTTQSALALNRNCFLAGAWCLSTKVIFLISKDFRKSFLFAGPNLTVDSFCQPWKYFGWVWANDKWDHSALFFLVLVRYKRIQLSFCYLLFQQFLLISHFLYSAWQNPRCSC